MKHAKLVTTTWLLLAVTAGLAAHQAMKPGPANLTLGEATGTYQVRWFNPRSGGKLLEGAVKQVTGGGSRSLGQPPRDANEDWLIVLRK